MARPRPYRSISTPNGPAVWQLRNTGETDEQIIGAVARMLPESELVGYYPVPGENILFDVSKLARRIGRGRTGTSRSRWRGDRLRRSPLGVDNDPTGYLLCRVTEYLRGRAFRSARPL